MTGALNIRLHMGHMRAGGSSRNFVGLLVALALLDAIAVQLGVSINSLCYF